MRKLFFCLALLYPIIGIQALSLKQAEKVALRRSAELSEVQSKQKAKINEAIASSQLKDPMIEFAAANFPTDTMSSTQENMTQLQLGIKQALPKGRTLSLNYKKSRAEALVFQHMYRLKRLEILKNVRKIWVERYFYRQSRWILLKKRATFRHLIEVSRSLYENGKVEQRDVLNARLQYERVKERIIDVERNYQRTTKQLARWIGARKAATTHPKHMPNFKRLPSKNVMKRRLKKHPTILADAALYRTGIADVELKKQDYKPGITIGLSYGHRNGDGMNGRPRADFLSARVGMDLPLFTRLRQDKSVKAKERLLTSIRYKQLSDYRNLRERLESQYVEWLATGDELHLYRQKLIPNARTYSEATLISYQNLKTDFRNVAQSYIELYDLRLLKEKSRFTHAIAKIELLYLQGIA